MGENVSEAAATQQEAGTEVSPNTPNQPKKSKKKLILFIAIPVILLILGGAGAYFMGFFGSEKKQSQKASGNAAENEKSSKGEGEHDHGSKSENAVQEKDRPQQSVFFALPEMMINLASEVGKVSYLKLQVSLELDDQKSIDKLQKVMPRLVDTIQVYTRELRISDFSNSLSIERLRQELLKRLSLIVKDVKIYDVLFTEMLTQ